MSKNRDLWNAEEKLCDMHAYDLRQRIQSLQMPEHSTHLSDRNFLTRMLYKKKQILGLHNSNPTLPFLDCVY